MRISLRELFWLTLIIGLCVSWGVERRRIQCAFANARPITRNRLPVGAGMLTHASRTQVFREFSDKQLIAHLPNANGQNYTEYLLELSKRRMSTQLRSMYTAEKQAPSIDPNSDSPYTPTASLWDNRELLTALRRAEGNPDPIEIEIHTLGTDHVSKLTSSPFIILCMRNVDAEREPFYIEDGIVTPECWHLRLTNSRGEVMPQQEWEPANYHGGLYEPGMLHYDQKSISHHPLDVRNYLKQPPAGRYKLELVCSNYAIGNYASWEGICFWKSSPVPVIVEVLALPSQWEVIRSPLCIVGALIVFCSAASIQRGITRPAPAGAMLQRRDVISLSIILLLAVVWSCDSLLVLQSYENRDLDSQSSWSIRLIR